MLYKDKDKKFGFTEKKSRIGIFFRRYARYVSLVAISLTVPVLGIFYLSAQSSVREQPGPIPDTQLTSVAPESVLGQEAAKVPADTQNNSTDLATPPEPSASQPQNQSLNQPVEKASGFGIAAGGDLTFFSQDKLNQYFDSLKSLGVKWVRWDVDWSVIQKDGPASFNWEGTDRVAQTAKRYGINSLGLLTYSPRWASDKSCKDGLKCSPVDPKKFGRFAGQAASRYKNSITSWEIWNEPNLSYRYRWGKEANVKKYADVLKNAYAEIKNANPSAIVMSGGLAPAADGKGKGGDLSPLTFIKSLYASGANQSFDAVALHPSSFPVSAPYKAPWNSWQQMYSVRQLMVSKGDSGKKIWITEYGAPTGGPGKARSLNYLNFKHDYDYMSESAQKTIVQDTIKEYKLHLDWMAPFFWYSLRDLGTKKDTNENFYGLLRSNGSKKPAYDAFRSAALSNR